MMSHSRTHSVFFGWSTLLLFGALLSTGCTGVRNRAELPEEISLADRVAIADLLARYSHTYDGRDTDAFAALFTEDAEITVQAEPIVGRSAIRDWAADLHAKRPSGIQVRHFQTNTLLVPIDRDRVRARTMLILTWHDSAKPYGTGVRLMATGIYQDELHRTAEGWRFFRRAADIEFPLEPAFRRESR